MFISLNMLHCRNRWKKSLSNTWLWVSDQKQVLVINSPFVWTKEPLNSRGRGNAETKAEFSASFPLNTRKPREPVAQRITAAVKGHRAGCVCSSQQQGSHERGCASWLGFEWSQEQGHRNRSSEVLLTGAQGRQTHHGIRSEKAPGPFSG